MYSALQMSFIPVYLTLFVEYCSLGYITPGANGLTCTTSVPQQNLLRTALALAEFGKFSGSIFRFSLTIDTWTDPTTSFPITLYYSNPIVGMKIGFFLVVIKAQST